MSVAQIISLFSGIALFLFGMTLMGDGLKRVSGSRLEPVLFRLSGTPLRGILLGAGVTAIIQSSSATSIMAVGFVNAGLMQVRQSISVVLGSILGTSITGWVICLSYIDGTTGLSSLLSTATLTGIIAVIGIILRMFSKNPTYHHIGDIMMGFSVLMFGMTTMSDALGGLGEQSWFTSLLTSMTHPLLGILIGTVFAAVLQSASAAVGIVQALSISGVMPLSAALPVLMGINIGACVPVLLSALGANTNGKRTAVSYFVASFMGVMIVASLFYIADAIFRFSFMNTIMNPVSLALTNTLMRLIILCLLAPFTDVLEAVSSLLVPEKHTDEEDLTVRLEERFLSHPALAIEQSRDVICNMAEQTDAAVKEAAGLLIRYTDAGFNRVKELEAAGDRCEDTLGSYLVKLTLQEMTERQSREASIFLHTLSDFERVSDHALNIAKSAQELHDKNLSFSDDAKRELRVMIDATLEALRLTTEAFVNSNLDQAVQVEPLEELIDDLCDEMKLRHVERLQRGQCTIVLGFVFNDLLTSFERISDHCSNIAVAMIELNSGVFDTHEYLGQIREKRSPDFERYYEAFRERFSLWEEQE